MEYCKQRHLCEESSISVVVARKNLPLDGRAIAGIVREEVDHAAGFGSVQEGVLDGVGARGKLHAASDGACAGNAGSWADEIRAGAC